MIFHYIPFNDFPNTHFIIKVHHSFVYINFEIKHVYLFVQNRYLGHCKLEFKMYYKSQYIS